MAYRKPRIRPRRSATRVTDPRLIDDCKQKLLREPGPKGERSNATVNRYLTTLSAVYTYGMSPAVSWVTQHVVRTVGRKEEPRGLPHGAGDGSLAPCSLSGRRVDSQRSGGIYWRERWHWVNLFEDGGYDRLMRSLMLRRQTLEAREAGQRRYQALATSRTPALVIYLVDISKSMGKIVGSETKEAIVSNAIARMFVRMIQRSTKGEVVSPRYRISIYVYADNVFDVLKGAKGIDEIAAKGSPRFSVDGATNTASAFLAVENFLREEVRQMQGCPAPLILHITDGHYSGRDPVPIVRRIMEMSVSDGNVLVANLFLSDGALVKPIERIEQWQGIRTPDDLSGEYAKKLFAMSSVIPESYRAVMLEEGYNLAPGARMLFPGTYPELIELGFSLSGATPVY